MNGWVFNGKIKHNAKSVCHICWSWECVKCQMSFKGQRSQNLVEAVWAVKCSKSHIAAQQVLICANHCSLCMYQAWICPMSSYTFLTVSMVSVGTVSQQSCAVGALCSLTWTALLHCYRTVTMSNVTCMKNWIEAYILLMCVSNDHQRQFYN